MQKRPIRLNCSSTIRGFGERNATGQMCHHISCAMADISAQPSNDNVPTLGLAAQRYLFSVLRTARYREKEWSKPMTKSLLQPARLSVVNRKSTPHPQWLRNNRSHGSVDTRLENLLQLSG